MERFGWPFWIGVVADDIEPLRRFYRDVLGFREVAATPDYVEFDVDGNRFELLRRTDEPQYDRPRVQVGFDVDDIERARQELIEGGAEAITGVLGGPDSVNVWAYFRDPAGNVFEITQRVR